MTPRDLRPAAPRAPSTSKLQPSAWLPLRGAGVVLLAVVCSPSAFGACTEPACVSSAPATIADVYLRDAKGEGAREWWVAIPSSSEKGARVDPESLPPPLQEAWGQLKSNAQLRDGGAGAVRLVLNGKASGSCDGSTVAAIHTCVAVSSAAFVVEFEDVRGGFSAEGPLAIAQVRVREILLADEGEGPYHEVGDSFLLAIRQGELSDDEVVIAAHPFSHEIVPAIDGGEIAVVFVSNWTRGSLPKGIEYVVNRTTILDAASQSQWGRWYERTDWRDADSFSEPGKAAAWERIMSIIETQMLRGVE